MIVHTKAYGKLQVKARYKERDGPEIVKKSFTIGNQTESDNPTGKTYPTSAQWSKLRELTHPAYLKIKTATERPR